MNDLSASVQLQLNQLRDGSATANNAINSRFANSASLATLATTALTANSASYATLAGSAQTALFAQEASIAAVATLANNATTADFADSAGVATLAVTATNATFASTCTSASSAALLGGISQDDAATSNTIARRTLAGALEATVFRHTNGVDPGSVGWVVTVRDADGYFRPVTVDQFGTYVSARNITTKSGTTKTLSTSAPSGGSNGDIWYRYS